LGVYRSTINANGGDNRGTKTTKKKGEKILFLRQHKGDGEEREVGNNRSKSGPVGEATLSAEKKAKGGGRWVTEKGKGRERFVTKRMVLPFDGQTNRWTPKRGKSGK